MEGKKFCLLVVGSAANSVGATLEFALFRSGPDPKYSRASAFLFFSAHNHGFYGGPNTFSQKNTRQLCKYNNEVSRTSSGRLVEWLQQFLSIRAAGARIREGGNFFHSFSFSFGNYFKK